MFPFFHSDFVNPVLMHRFRNGHINITTKVGNLLSAETPTENIQMNRFNLSVMGLDSGWCWMGSYDWRGWWLPFNLSFRFQVNQSWKRPASWKFRFFRSHVSQINISSSYNSPLVQANINTAPFVHKKCLICIQSGASFPLEVWTKWQLTTYSQQLLALFLC